MINNLKLALALSERFNEPDVIVSKDVLLEVLSHVIEDGQGHTRLNLTQTNPSYPYMHKVMWRGITFIHFSRKEFSDKQYMAV